MTARTRRIVSSAISRISSATSRPTYKSFAKDFFAAAKAVLGKEVVDVDEGRALLADPEQLVDVAISELGVGAFEHRVQVACGGND